MSSFLETLKVQRWDDHRYYHHSRINQSLHFVSAISFLVSYVFLFINPPVAALIAWLISMVSRQSGHFFFEPKGYDHVNHASHEYKEEIKVGYNLKRKMVLIAIWALAPLVIYMNPDLFGLLTPHTDLSGFVLNVGWAWLYIGIGGLLFRTLHLFWLKDVQSGLSWATKIITDPVHDILLYYKAPYQLLKGELFAPNENPTEELSSQQA